MNNDQTQTQSGRNVLPFWNPEKNAKAKIRFIDRQPPKTTQWVDRPLFLKTIITDTQDRFPRKFKLDNSPPELVEIPVPENLLHGEEGERKTFKRWQVTSLIFTGNYVSRQVQRKLHKKRRNQSESYHRRVNKKWLKRFGTLTVQEKEMKPVILSLPLTVFAAIKKLIEADWGVKAVAIDYSQTRSRPSEHYSVRGVPLECHPDSDEIMIEFPENGQ